jgi:hypothetical protein
VPPLLRITPHRLLETVLDHRFEILFHTGPGTFMARLRSLLLRFVLRVEETDWL